MKKQYFAGVAILATLSVFLAGCFGGSPSVEEEITQSSSSETESSQSDLSITTSSTGTMILPDTSSSIGETESSAIDTEYIQAYLIGWGEGVGLTYDSTLTTDTAGYDKEITYDTNRKSWTTESITENLQTQFRSTVQTITTVTPEWRGTRFCPVLLDNEDGTYTGYILYTSVLNSDMQREMEEATNDKGKSDSGENSKTGTGDTKGQSKTGSTASKSEKETTKTKSAKG